MAITMLTSSGHIHLPPAIRAHLGIKPGDKLQLRILRDGRVVMDLPFADRGNHEPINDNRRGVSRLETGVDWDVGD